MSKDFISFTNEEITMPKKVSKNSGNTTYEQQVLDDEDTGMMIKRIRYPKNTITDWHTHNCAHGMYVISGELYTSEGTFGAGSFVWFKEGMKAFHGGKDQDADCLFITNKPFDIHYLNKK